MCQAELVHEVNIAVSFVPIMLSVWVGALPVFVITSILAAGYDLLFVREFKTDRITNGAVAYTYLGTANYVKHEGSRPMIITWKLDHPIPAKFLKKTNKLVVG